MSDLLNTPPDCAALAHPCSGIRIIVTPRDSDIGGGFFVRRLLPAAELRSLGPFIFFDHLGPAIFEPGTGIDVKPHPHIGLATITYLFDGEILHRDNLGCVQLIEPGAINWMTAGRGIAHSERTPPERRRQRHSLHALQLWVALPAADEETEPAFHHYPVEAIPLVTQNGAKMRVLIGSAGGATSPVKTFSPTLYLEVVLEDGATFRLPNDVEERGIYVVAGSVRVGGAAIATHSLATFEAGPEIELVATEECRLVVIGGQSLGKRTVWWNLAATRRELIEEAKTTWKEGGFAPIPGETEFAPLPE
jgi:redox-sensitive bicupin YhaK (pirin superfamily)